MAPQEFVETSAKPGSPVSVGLSHRLKLPVFVTVTTCLVCTEPTILPPKLKLEVLSVAVVCPILTARAAVVEWVSSPDVAVRVMGTEGVTAAFEAVSRIWPDCPGIRLIVDWEAVTPEGRPLTVTLMALLKSPTAVAVIFMA